MPYDLHGIQVGVGTLLTMQLYEKIKAITPEIDCRGYLMVPRFIDSDADEVKAGAILEREKKLRGLIFLGGRFDYTPAELASIGIPFVCCSYTNCFGTLREEDYSSVSIDDHLTAYRATEVLIRRGHRRIAAAVPSISDRSISELRFKGFRDALRDYGLAYDPALLVETGGCCRRPTAASASSSAAARISPPCSRSPIPPRWRP